MWQLILDMLSVLLFCYDVLCAGYFTLYSACFKFLFYENVRALCLKTECLIDISEINLYNLKPIPAEGGYR